MVWILALAGLFVGLMFQSFNTAMVLAFIGGFVGYLIKNKDTSQGKAEVLERKIDALKAQVVDLNRRLAVLEKNSSAASHLPAATDGVSPAVDKQDSSAPVPTTKPANTENPEPLVRHHAVTKEQNSVSLRQETLGPEKPAPQPPADKLPPKESIAPAVKPAAPPPPPRPPAPPSAFQQFIQRWVIGGNPLVKIGVVILFLGLGFLLRYAAAHAVFPIELRYASVAAIGISLLLFGWRWRHKKDNYGLILQGGGIGVLYLTTLAAMRLHPLIPLEFGFAVLIAVAVFAALLAILQDALALAVAAAIGGFAAPVLASSGSGNHVALFSYLTLLNLGIVAIAWFKAWRVLNLVGFGCSFFLGSAWAAKHYQPELYSSTQPFLLLLFVLYVLITVLFARRTLAEAQMQDSAGMNEQLRQSASKVSYVDGSLAFGVPFATFSLQYLLMRPFEYGASFSALGFGLFYVLVATALFRGAGRRYLLLNETLIAVGVVFGSLAIPLGLEDKWTSAAWAIEAAGVYWVGIRQHKLHARLFALLLALGAAVYFLLGLHVAPPDQDHVLNGSRLGCILLALGTGWICRLMRRADAPELHGIENAARPWLLGSGAIAIALIPFILLPMEWACPSLALIGAASLFLSLRWTEPWLLRWGCLFQAAAGILFMTTLHRADGSSVLSNGWGGLLAASIIGASMLVAVWAMVRQSLARSEDKPAPSFGLATSIGLLAGLAFVNLAPLFVLPWRLAAMVWPLTGIATLWWAVRMRHSGAILFALVLQALAGFAWFGSRIVLFPADAATLDESLRPFAHSGFIGPLLISVAAFICARLLQRSASPDAGSPLHRMLGWIALSWGGAWWAFAWAEETTRVISVDANAFACLVAIAGFTAWLWSAVARYLRWPQLGAISGAYLPALFLIAMSAWIAGLDHPSAGFGWLVWPAALLMHFYLLRRQENWLPRRLLGLLHTAGAWLFVVQAATELRWHFAQWGEAGSAWALLGWMIAPVAYLFIVTLTGVQRRWPLSGFSDAYRLHAAVPVVLYLFGWVWISNAVSNGAAAPLPYLPVLNPLEIAHAAVLLAAALWWWPLREHASLQGIRTFASIVAGSTIFFAITGMVARACHHLGRVAWNLDALLASELFQTSLSVVWTVLAISLMLFGNRQRQRAIWIIGAILIAVVVGKLFLVELNASGSLTRIVSFIVVGLLLLVVGYVAPLPPKQKTGSSEPEVQPS
jgi:uncharacterized membrane protein